jgi:hypothetical protein
MEVTTNAKDCNWGTCKIVANMAIRTFGPLIIYTQHMCNRESERKSTKRYPVGIVFLFHLVPAIFACSPNIHRSKQHPKKITCANFDFHKLESNQAANYQSAFLKLIQLTLI